MMMIDITLSVTPKMMDMAGEHTARSLVGPRSMARTYPVRCVGMTGRPCTVVVEVREDLP